MLNFLYALKILFRLMKVLSKSTKGVKMYDKWSYSFVYFSAYKAASSLYFCQKPWPCRLSSTQKFIPMCMLYQNNGRVERMDIKNRLLDSLSVSWVFLKFVWSLEDLISEIFLWYGNSEPGNSNFDMPLSSKFKR